MRYWVQFLVQSTGYVAGTTPPRFSPDAVRLIDACGSDGVYILDGRNDSETMHSDALKIAQRREHYKQYSGYVICKGPRLFNETWRSPKRELVYPIRVRG